MMRHGGSVPWMGFSVLQRWGGADSTSPSPLWASLYARRLVGTSAHSSCLSVRLCPLTRVFTFDVCVSCWAYRCLIMSRPRQAPPNSSNSSFEVLSMEDFITWKCFQVACSDSKVMRLLSRSYNARVETNSPEIHVKFAHAFRFLVGHCSARLTLLNFEYYI